MDNSAKLPTVLSLCTGYGGIERGLELAGFRHRVVAHVEIEAFAIANLVAKMEQCIMDPAPIWTDLKTLPLEPFRERIDIITGGYPCQPFSTAGERQGDQDPRHLWPYIRKAIDTIRPGTCFFENVEGHISMGLSDVIEDLARMGYRSTWGIFSANEVGAPHQRKRIFIMAHALWFHGSGPGRKIRGRWGVCKGGEVGGDQMADSKSEPRRRLPFGENAKFPKPPGNGQYGWEQPRTIKSRLGGANDGFRTRIDRLRLLGNGVVPQCAAKAFTTLMGELSNE